MTIEEMLEARVGKKFYLDLPAKVYWSTQRGGRVTIRYNNDDGTEVWTQVKVTELKDKKGDIKDAVRCEQKTN